MEAIVGRMSIPSSPLDSQPPNSTFTLQRHAVGADRSFNLWTSPWDINNHHTPLFSDLLTTNSGNTANTVASHYDHHHTFESLQEMEAHTIGNLLPTDDDFLFGLVDGLENTLQISGDADADDMDVFKNVGGMDLGDDAPSPKTSHAPFAGEHPYGESPSRTLFVTNINSDIAGNKIKLEATRPGALRQSPVHSDMEQIENCQLLKQNKSGYPRGPASSSSVDSVCSFGTNTSWASFRPFMEKPAFHGISCSVPNGLPSLPRTESADIQPGLSEFSNSVGQFNSDFRGLQVPHSRAEYNNGVANGVPCYSDRDIPASGGFLPQERVESTHLGSISSSSDMGNAFGTSVNGSGHVHGQHYMWSNSNYSQSPTFIWPSSSQLCSPQPQSRLQGISRTPSHASPLNIHHVGSAPAVSPYLRDKRYAGGSPEASGFHQGSFGSMRIPNSHFHHMDFFPPNMYPHVGGNFMDLPISSRDIGVYAQQRGLFMYPSRGHMAKSFVSVEHARSRRNDSFSTPADNKKLYELDIDRISQGEDNRTTLMIKNIPNKYTSKMLMAAIDEHHRGTYDFIYLPIDFKNKCNVGYAFINMVDPSYIIRFYESFNGKKWEKFNSEKVASLAYGRIQGKEALITHFQNSSLMNEDKRCRPILFHSDGPNAGDQVPFPMGVNIRSKSARSRSNSNGDTHQGTPPILPKEEYSSGDSSSSCTF